MDNVSRFFESLVNVEHTVLGVRLRPFCLLHLLWLTQLKSPLVETSLPMTLGALELAALICSSKTSEEILTKIKKPRRLWRFWNRYRTLQQETKRFLAYQDDHCALPEYSDAQGNSIERLPSLLLQAASIIKETGWSEQTVMNLPLGKLLWYNAAYAYLRSGETSVVSDHDRAAFEALRALTPPEENR